MACTALFDLSPAVSLKLTQLNHRKPNNKVMHTHADVDCGCSQFIFYVLVFPTCPDGVQGGPHLRWSPASVPWNWATS